MHKIIRILPMLKNEYESRKENVNYIQTVGARFNWVQQIERRTRAEVKCTLSTFLVHWELKRN